MVTHWIVEIDVWNSRARVSRATLTIVVSRIDMTAPRMTTIDSRRSTGSLKTASLRGAGRTCPGVSLMPCDAIGGSLRASTLSPLICT